MMDLRGPVTWSKLIGSTDVARILGVSRRTAIRMMYDGRLPSHEFGKQRRIRERELEPFAPGWRSPS